MKLINFIINVNGQKGGKAMAVPAAPMPTTLLLCYKVWPLDFLYVLHSSPLLKTYLTSLWFNWYNTNRLSDPISFILVSGHRKSSIKRNLQMDLFSFSLNAIH